MEPTPHRRDVFEKLRILAQGLDELRANEDMVQFLRLPSEFSGVWNCTVNAIQGSVRFLAAMCNNEPTQTSRLEAAGYLAGKMADLQAARLAGHVAMTKFIVEKPPSIDSSQELSSTSGSLRALCPRCQEHYELSSSYYADIATTSVSARLQEVQKRCNAKADDLRKNVDEERARLRKLLKQELELLAIACNFEVSPTTENEQDADISKALSLSCNKEYHIEQESQKHGLIDTSHTNPRIALTGLKQRIDDLKHKRNRRISREEFENACRLKTAEVMRTAEGQLAKFCDTSMFGYCREALESPLLSDPISPSSPSQPRTVNAHKILVSLESLEVISFPSNHSQPRALQADGPQGSLGSLEVISFPSNHSQPRALQADGPQGSLGSLEMISLAPKKTRKLRRGRSIPQQEEQQWSVDCVFQYPNPEGPSADRLADILVLYGSQGYTIDSVISQLNAGTLSCPWGICILFSSKEQTCHCIYRRDKKRVAQGRFAISEDERLVREYRAHAALDVLEAAPLTPGATPANTPPLTPGASPRATPRVTAARVAALWPKPAVASLTTGMLGRVGLDITPQTTPRARQYTPRGRSRGNELSSQFRMDVEDTPVEAYEAVVAGRDVTENYSMMSARCDPWQPVRLDVDDAVEDIDDAAIVGREVCSGYEMMSARLMKEFDQCPNASFSLDDDDTVAESRRAEMASQDVFRDYDMMSARLAKQHDGGYRPSCFTLLDDDLESCHSKNSGRRDEFALPESSDSIIASKSVTMESSLFEPRLPQLPSVKTLPGLPFCPPKRRPA